MILDSMIVRTHQHAAGANIGGLAIRPSPPGAPMEPSTARAAALASGEIAAVQWTMRELA